MLATAIIVFREVLEAALIVSIVLAATRGVPSRGRWVAIGLAAGCGGAIVVALFAELLASAAAGMGQELFNAGVLFTAVIMLGWHNVWMKRHAREMTGGLRAVGDAVRQGNKSLAALALVVGLAVLREGSELVLFLYGVAASGADSALSMAAGGAAGLALGVGASALLYLGLLSIPSRHLFQTTSVLILLLAAGMSAQGAAFLVQADWLPSFGDAVWDTSGIVPDGSLAGRLLHALIGYTAQPSGIQLGFYLVTLVAISAAMHATNRTLQPTGPGRAARAAAG